MRSVGGGAIAHDTSVMTPTGWMKHGDLRPGDQVYAAADGAAVAILQVHPEVLEECFELLMRDGSRIVCTASQRWPVAEFTGSGRRLRTVSTAEMAEIGAVYERRLTTGRTKATKGGVARWRTLASPPVEGAVAEFPLPPYVLGYWLGDGDSDAPRLTVHRDDVPSLLGVLDGLGVEHGDPTPTHGETFRVRFGRGWAKRALRDANLLNNKNIPQRLLRAGVQQRWELLQGIVDSDGTVGTNGVVEVTVKAGPLADDIFELAVSLGLMPRRNDSPARLRGLDYGTRARIKFAPQPGEIVAVLPRKLERTQLPRVHAAPFSRSRTITQIRAVDPVPARGVTVEHPTQQYLVSERNVPTCSDTGRSVR